MIKLICPSCNGSLELPDNMDVAHCLYCGTRILLRENKNSNNIQQFIELSKTALSAENYKEAIEYCNKILEIDSKNIDAWIDKAYASFQQTTTSDNKFDDAIIYLKKAYKLSPEYDRTIESLKDIVEKYALWENRLGIIDYEHAVKLQESLKRLDSSSENGILGLALMAVGTAANYLEAKNKSLPFYQSAVIHYLKAAHYKPSDINILNNIYLCTQKADWYDWNQMEGVSILIDRKIRLEKKIAAEKELEPLKRKIKNLENSLQKLNSSNNLFKNTKEKEIKTEIENLEKWVVYHVKNALYQPPEFDIHKLLIDQDELSNTQLRKVARSE